MKSLKWAGVLAVYLVAVAVAPAQVYNGLVQELGGFAPERSGSFQITVSAAGRFTGNMNIAGGSVPLKGVFDPIGGAVVYVSSRNGTTGGELSGWRVYLSKISDGQVLLGSVFRDVKPAWSANLVGYRAVQTAKTNPAPQAGTYTLLLPGGTNAAEAPIGDGHGVLRILPNGTVNLTGMLPDGTRITHSAVLSDAGVWPVFVPFFAGKGCLFGWLQVQADNANFVTGNLAWHKPAAPRPLSYTNGFIQEMVVEGVPYVPPARGASAFPWAFGTVFLSEGDLTEATSQIVSVGANNKLAAIGSPANRLTLTFRATDGSMTGSFIHPVTRRSTKFCGVLFQELGEVRGFFLGPTQGGYFSLRGL